VERAAWGDAGRCMPPQPKPTCGLAGGSGDVAPCRGRVLAGNGDGGRVLAGNGDGGRVLAMHLPASAQAARSTCRLPRRAVIRRGSFLTNFSAGGLF
jgi:hypothetical protein